MSLGGSAGTPEHVLIEAADGVRLAARVVSGPERADAAVVLLPGFWRRADSPRIRELAALLARRHPVLTLDFRGHGLSSGRFTFGRLEHLDVEAALAFAASRGVRRVALVGTSMGGAALLAALGRPGAPPLPS